MEDRTRYVLEYLIEKGLESCENTIFEGPEKEDGPIDYKHLYEKTLSFYEAFVRQTNDQFLAMDNILQQDEHNE